MNPRTLLVSGLALGMMIAPLAADPLAPSSSVEASTDEAGTDLDRIGKRLEQIETELLDRDLATLADDERDRLRHQLHHLWQEARRSEDERAERIRRQIARLERSIANGKPIRQLEPAMDQPRSPTEGNGGGIAGTVVEVGSGMPIANLRVEIRNPFFGFASAITGESGHYSVGGLAQGSYTALTNDSSRRFINELYDDMPCPGLDYYGNCDLNDGTMIEVADDAVTANIDFDLIRGGSIAGTVTRTDTGAPTGSADIDVWDTTGTRVAFGSADSDGDYEVGALVSGTYFVTVEVFGNVLRDELYDDIPCANGPFGGCDPTTGTPVEVTVGTVTDGIDFALEKRGSIEGTLIASDTLEPITSRRVEIWDSDGYFLSSDFTDSLGRYAVNGLDPGTYFAATAVSTTPYQDELFDDIPCPNGPGSGGCNATSGTPINVAPATATTDIDFALDRLGGIAGTVVDQATGNPLSQIFLRAADASGATQGTATTGFGGRYRIDGIDEGDVFVATSSIDYLDEAYDDRFCFDTVSDCFPTIDGDPIPVALGSITAGIDFELDRAGAGRSIQHPVVAWLRTDRRL